MGMLGLWTCALHLLPEEAVAATGVDFPVQSLEDAGWEGRHDAPSALLRTMFTESLPD
jgi:hypothetical protein